MLSFKKIIKHTKKSPTVVQIYNFFYYIFFKGLAENSKAQLIFFRDFPWWCNTEAFRILV